MVNYPHLKEGASWHIELKIEQEAKQIAAKYAPDLNHAQQYMESGFKLGAKWMKTELIKKSINWLSINGDRYSRLDKLVEEFKKTIEE